MSRTDALRVRPLYLREGTRYRCFGYGMCCSDMHGLGPLTRREGQEVRRLDSNGVYWDEEFEAPMLQTRGDGTCVFLGSDGLCSIHAQWGEMAKPDGCRRFPFGLVATPRGGRVTTDHRCPCRTLGPRPLATEQQAEGSLIDRGGRLVADRRVQQVKLTPRRVVNFARFEDEIESELLGRMRQGEPVEDVLDARAFPPLSAGGRWIAEADELIDSNDGTRFGLALAWVGDAIRACRGRGRLEGRPRPWAEAFDRAEAQGNEEGRTADDVLADWVADVLWAFDWIDVGALNLARAELATRVAIMRRITDYLVGQGARPDRAAAEAVLIGQIVGTSEYWEAIVKCMRV